MNKTISRSYREDELIYTQVLRVSNREPVRTVEKLWATLLPRKRFFKVWDTAVNGHAS